MIIQVDEHNTLIESMAYAVPSEILPVRGFADYTGNILGEFATTYQPQFIPTEFGAKFKEDRMKHRLGFGNVAKALGLRVAELSDIERGIILVDEAGQEIMRDMLERLISNEPDHPSP